MKDELVARVEELKQQREQFVNQANAQINAFAGAIAELERLIQSLEGIKDDGGEEE